MRQWHHSKFDSPDMPTFGNVVRVKLLLLPPSHPMRQWHHSKFDSPDMPTFGNVVHCVKLLLLPPSHPIETVGVIVIKLTVQTCQLFATLVVFCNPG